MKYSENEKQKSLLSQFLESFQVELPTEVLDRLYAFADLVVNTKEFGNLISSKDSEKFLSRHIADSLMPYIYISKGLGNPDFRINKNDNVKWADMGAGSGCPVFPLAIVMPEIQFYAIEPRKMRVKFMQTVKEKLKIDNLTVIGKRFETSGLENLDVVSCRALSTFENDWDRARPGLKKSGRFLTLKSFNNIVHLENDPAVHIYKYNLPMEEQIYALVTRGNE